MSAPSPSANKPLSASSVPIPTQQLWPVPGGVHPPANKRQSLQEPICTPPLPELLIVPLQQHIGNPATPIVSVGDVVAKGQLIAAPDGALSVGVHAPTSGTISAQGDYPVLHPSGLSGPCILLSPDGTERWTERRAIADYARATPAELLAVIRGAGIAGLGGAGFPSAVKLGSPLPIDTLIINAVECEPYITADDILMRERAADIVVGIQILAHIIGQPAQIVVGIEDDKPEAYETLVAACANTTIRLVAFPAKYPSGGEKQLIQRLTGREVSSGKIPAEIGVLCHNVATVYSIARAIAHGEPQISRVTTVTGAACTQPRNYDVLLGTPIRHLLALSGFNADGGGKVIVGGPMMGFAQLNLDAPVIKTTNCLLAPSFAEMPPLPPAQACIRCGLCAQACPASLLPQQLFWYSQAGNHERLQAHNLFDCIECGACSYVCPSHIPLVQYYRASKGEIRTQEKERISSDLARQRFAQHQQRLARQQEQREVKRAARRSELAGATDSHSTTTATASAQPAEDLIQAAARRAAQKQASPAQQIAALERRLVAAQHLRDTAHEKWLAGTVDHLPTAQLDSLRATLEEAELRLQGARNKLNALSSDQNERLRGQDDNSNPTTDPRNDDAQESP